MIKIIEAFTVKRTSLDRVHAVELFCSVVIEIKVVFRNVIVLTLIKF